MFRLRVKEILQEKGISQNALSIGAGIAINMVRKLVHDPRYDPASSTLFKVARFLRVNMSELCYDDSDAEPISE
ncbi:MAG TPA: helix-turn-helix transcriptional regulator [Ktedonobacteraceae bacterium]